MEKETIIVLFILFAYYFIFIITDSVSDTIQHHYYESKIQEWILKIEKKFKIKILHWFTPDSWLNKYVDRNPKKGRRKIEFLGYYFNFPVQFTDFFHYNKMWYRIYVSAILCLPFLYFSILIYLITFIVVGILGNILFSYFYETVLIKKEYRK